MPRRNMLLYLFNTTVEQFEKRLSSFVFEYDIDLIKLNAIDLANWPVVHNKDYILGHYRLSATGNKVIAELLLLQSENNSLGLDILTYQEDEISQNGDFVYLSLGNDFLDSLIAHFDSRAKYWTLERKIFEFNNVRIVYLDYLRTNISLFIEWLAWQSVGADVPLYIPSLPQYDASRFRFVSLKGHGEGYRNPMTVYYSGAFTPVGHEKPVLTKRVISFKLQQLAPERLQVKALCHPCPKYVREQFDLLLNNVCRVWPETILSEENIDAAAASPSTAIIASDTIEPFEARLRKVMISLFSDELSIRRVCTDANLDLGRIHFNNTVENIWYSVITEASKSNLLDALLNVATEIYDTNKELKDVCERYKSIQAQ